MLAGTMESVVRQSYRPISMLITDDSDDENVESVRNLVSKFQSEFSDGISIRHIRNPGKKGVSTNTNFGLSEVHMGLVHVLHSDDIISRDDLYALAMERIPSSKSKWLVVGGSVEGEIFLPDPTFSALKSGMILGVNPIGGPSGVIFFNSLPIKYNESLNNYCDLDFYFKLFSNFGQPVQFAESFIEYGVGDWQIQRIFGSLENSVMEISELLKSHNFSSADCLKEILGSRSGIRPLLIPVISFLMFKFRPIGRILLLLVSKIIANKQTS
jgi:hypothetical protein